MTKNEIITFINTKMKMSHVYQPLLIKTLVEAGGVATLNQLARAFAAADESQVRFYERRIKQMPLKVLKRDRKCLLCGNGPDDAPLEVDHIVPQSKGGSNDITNLQVLCRPCNQGKSNQDDTDFTGVE